MSVRDTAKPVLIYRVYYGCYAFNKLIVSMTPLFAYICIKNSVTLPQTTNYFKFFKI